MELINVVLPVFLLIGLGLAARRWLGLEPRPFARLSLYIMSPALSLHAVLTAQLRASEVAGIIGFAAAWTAAMVAITLLVSRTLRLGRTAESSLLLAGAFCNSANYGLPVVLFSLGQAGFDRAIVFVVYMALSMATLGVFFAARGAAAAAEVAAAADDGLVPGGGPGPRPAPGVLPWRRALERTLRMPLAYAALLGTLLRLLNVSLPEAVMRPLAMVAQATVPLLVIILGLQMGVTLEALGRRRAAQAAVAAAWAPAAGPVAPVATASVAAAPGAAGPGATVAGGQGWAVRIGTSAVLRLIISPLVAYAIAGALALEPLTRMVLTIEAAMPIAANINLLAIEFGAEPDLTAAATVVTTGLSVVTITVLLGLLL